MSNVHAEVSPVAMQISRGVVVASIQLDLDEATLHRFREDLLHRIRATGLRGVILDISALDTLDSEEFAGLRNVMVMCELMGAKPVLAGMRPGVVSALIEAGVDTDNLQTAIDLDAAYAILRPQPTAALGALPGEEPEPAQGAIADHDRPAPAEAETVPDS